jgi:APA family basic amino acid/polyamine antiporter
MYISMFAAFPALQVGMYATSRIVAAVGRQHILPPFLARVHPKLATPYVATIAQGVASAIIALFTDFADLAGESSRHLAC